VGARTGKSSLLLSFKKEARRGAAKSPPRSGKEKDSSFFEKKKQKTFTCWASVLGGGAGFRAPFKTWHGESDGVRF
jgi:hypothetical protein